MNASVLKAFSILKLLSPQQPEITTAVVASELQTNTATAHRFLTTLVAAGALVSYRRGYYTLGPLIDELGFAAQACAPSVARLRPLIQTLAQEVNESVMVCRLGMSGPTCIAVAKSNRPISVDINVGAVLAIDRTAHGKLWLSTMTDPMRSDRCGGVCAVRAADLDQIQSQGFSTNNGEANDGIGAIAVPILDSEGAMPLTLSIFGMQHRFDSAMLARALPMLRQTATSIAQILRA
jgi:IclR family pca regulon transcriptional regulator